MTAAPAGYRTAVGLGRAGQRIGEMLGMAADRVAIDRREVTVDQQAQPLNGRGMVLTTPKTERARTIRGPGLGPVHSDGGPVEARTVGEGV